MKELNQAQLSAVSGGAKKLSARVLALAGKLINNPNSSARTVRLGDDILTIGAHLKTRGW